MRRRPATPMAVLLVALAIAAPVLAPVTALLRPGEQRVAPSCIPIGPSDGAANVLASMCMSGAAANGAVMRLLGSHRGQYVPKPPRRARAAPSQRASGCPSTAARSCWGPTCR